MILIVGGAFQGKGQFARELAGKNAEVTDGCMNVPDLKRINHNSVILNYHAVIGMLMKPEPETAEKTSAAAEDIVKMTPDEYTRRLAQADPAVVTMDEVGCGIVPLEREQREYREAVGSAGQILAARADTVYRIVCGTAQKIK